MEIWRQMMKGRVLKTLIILVSLLLFVAGCHTDLDLQLFAKIAMVEDGSGAHYFPTLQKAIDYIVENKGSRDISRDVPDEIAKERTVVLLRDIKSNAGALTVYNYDSQMCIDLNGHEYFYSNSADSFVNILDNSEVRIKNGKLVILENNPSLRPVFIIGTQQCRTSVRLSDLVVDDRRNYGEVDAYNGRIYHNAVQVMGESTLVIDGRTELGNVFSANSDAKIEINNGIIDIFRLNEQYEPCSFSITGGTIHHTHEVDDRVKEAARGHESSITEDFVHVASDFSYILVGADTVKQHCKYFEDTGCSLEGETATIKTGAPVYDFKNAPYDDVAYIVYTARWEGIRTVPIYITDYSVSTNGNNKDVGTARVSAKFYDEDDRTREPVEIVTSFVIGDHSGGYAGFEVIPPEYIRGADGSVVEGTIGFDNATGKPYFTKNPDCDVEVTCWAWIIDGVEQTSGTNPDDINTDAPSLFRTPAEEENTGRTIICRISSLGGQADYGLRVVVPLGEIEYDASAKQLKFNQTNASDVEIKSYEWNIGGSTYTGTDPVLDMTTDLSPALSDGNYGVTLRCYFLHNSGDNTNSSYKEFTLLNVDYTT